MDGSTESFLQLVFSQGLFFTLFMLCNSSEVARNGLTLTCNGFTFAPEPTFAEQCYF